MVVLGKTKTDTKPFNKRASFAVTALSTLLLSVNLFLAEVNRGELLTRGFSNNYIVRAMGIPFFTAYSGNLTVSKLHKLVHPATADDMKKVETYVKGTMQHLILSTTELLKEGTLSLFTWRVSNSFLLITSSK